MPWIEAVLRGQRVLARAKADGSLAVEQGRVEIRYRPKDGRSYRAAAGNLTIAADAKLLADESVTDPSEKSGPASSPAQKPHVGTTDGWSAYVDGACSGNPGPAGCGVVIVAPGGRLHEGFEYLGEATNNVAELMGIVRALEWIPATVPSVVVHTDSQYSIGVLQKGWKAKANQELVRVAKEKVSVRRAQLVYVPGHRGVLLNERADELARQAVETRSSAKADVGSA
jgi:ribonuclease HI